MNEILWYTSRATGVVSLVLLTVVVVLGLVTAGGRRPRGISSTVVMGLHRSLSLGMGVFLLSHIATAIVEGYVAIDWISAVLPFTSGYERVTVGLGTLAVDLMFAVGVTSALRHRLRESTWRGVHTLSYLLWPVAVVHGLALGTADEPILRGTSIACAGIGLGAVTWRLLTTNSDERRRREVAVQEWS